MFQKWRRNRAIAKVKPGDGSTLKPYRRWQPVSRSLFFLALTDAHGQAAEYAVDVPYFSESWKADLYCEGIQVATSKLPAVFPVPGGAIEVNASSFGLSRMHFVPHEGPPRTLNPHPHSGEGLRARFDQRFPKTSRAIGALAILVLLTSLIVLLPQLVEWISHTDLIANNLGTFTSPITLAAWANTALFVAGLMASVERALTLRNHWLIDAETWWLGD